MPKTVPLSVRISHEDAEFLARLEIDKAKTPSDKVRAIIAEHRRHTLAGQPSYSQVLSWITEILAPVSMKLRENQSRERSYSELFRFVDEWLPDLLALYLTEGKAVQDRQGLDKLEGELFDKVFRLIESVLRMGVTEHSPSIDQKAISKRITTTIQLVEVIKNGLQERRGK